MRATYIKPHSHTQQQAQGQVQVVNNVCQQLGINFEEWLMLMFELGCDYCESVSPTPTLAAQRLQDPTFGFWAWWLHLYINDDALLLKHYPEIQSISYQHEKKQLANYYSQNKHEEI